MTLTRLAATLAVVVGAFAGIAALGHDQAGHDAARDALRPTMVERTSIIPDENGIPQTPPR